MKAGYTFVGWNTKADGKGVTYKIGQTIQMGKGNLILYALWSKTMYQEMEDHQRLVLHQHLILLHQVIS